MTAILATPGCGSRVERYSFPQAEVNVNRADDCLPHLPTLRKSPAGRTVTLPRAYVASGHNRGRACKAAIH